MKTFYEVEFGNCEFRVYGEAIPRKVGVLVEADNEHAAIAKAQVLVFKIRDDCDWVLSNVKQKEPTKKPQTKLVWLLWISDTETPWVEGVFADKVEAEAAMRTIKVGDDGRGYLYWIQEKEVQA